MSSRSLNTRAAGIFRDCAELLRQQKANPFRINAYLRAAQTLESMDDDVAELLQQEGIEGLVALPTIGRGLAASIDEIARTGRLAQLDRLRGDAKPEALFQSIPGVGPTLAHLLHDTLHVDTLEDLELAAHDGRLAAVKGIGERRAEAIRVGISAMLGRAAGRHDRAGPLPTIDALLAIDADYRRKAAAGELPTIAPKRFNPTGSAWLPILHTRRGDWHFTVLYSNTARAHELGRTRDWVVIYFYDGDHHEGQCTVVTETHGPLAGKRIVRGREAEQRWRVA
jgi:putative hydrolase